MGVDVYKRYPHHRDTEEFFRLPLLGILNKKEYGS